MSTTCRVVRVRTPDGRIVFVKRCYPSASSLVTRSLGEYLATGAEDISEQVDIFEASCLLEADAKTAEMFAKRQEVKTRWNPTGTYTPDQLEAVVDAAFRMMRDAGVMILDKALADPQLPSGRSELTKARNEIFDQESKQFVYRDAIRDARAKGVEQISAPGLKSFVIGAMEVTQAAAFVAAKVACRRPWWLDVLVAALRIFKAAADFILSIPGIIYNAAKAAVKAAETIGTIIKYSLYGGVAIGAWWLYKKYGRRR